MRALALTLFQLTVDTSAYAYTSAMAYTPTNVYTSAIAYELKVKS